MQLVRFRGKGKYLKEFLRLPKRLYSRDELCQNDETEAQLLCGGHVLSHYFSVYGFLVMRDIGRALARCAVTLYPNERVAYVGFFESEDNAEAARMLFHGVEEFCRKNNISELFGPVDASFWIKYRLKTSHFGRPYACEPYNKAYYQAFFLDAGFKRHCMYYSNQYAVISAEHVNEKALRRLNQKTSEGYRIISPSKEEFESVLCEIYGLIVRLYKDFPIFRYITSEEFCALFKGLKHVLNYDMIKIAYFNDVPVGFFVGMPNYGNLICGKLTLVKLMRIYLYKRKPKEYIMLYMGVDAGHAGLGGALSQVIADQLKQCGATSVGALIQSGKASGGYFRELVTQRYEYSLYGKKLTTIKLNV